MPMLKVDDHGCWRSGGQPSAEPWRLLAVGDICPAQGFKLDELFTAGPEAAAAVYGDVLTELADKDLSIANLELPLSDRGQPIVKNGPCLKGPPAAIDSVLAGGFDAVTMANNHVMDFGPDAFFDTLDLCARHGLTVFGAGRDIEDAGRLVTIDRSGVRVGLLAFADNEFSNAGAATPGGSPFAPGPNCNLIARSRDACDLLIVFVHGGNEYCPLPSPRMVRDYRAFAEAGADAVIAHHPHTVQSMELHENVPILYSLGNFLFWNAPHRVPRTWWLEMAARLHFEGRRCVGLDILPVEMDRETASLRLVTGRQRAAFCQRLNRLSEILADADLHRRFWQAYCLKRLPHYLDWAARARADLDADHASRSRLVAAAQIKNQYACEAHHEIVVTAMDLVRQGLDTTPLGVEAELDQLMLDADG
jgi:poly-gamma-glutamate capsule biosynthesis protein CapA/YwtB (metallophosphatase superfamily)